VIPRKDLPRIYTMCLPIKGKDRVPGIDGDPSMAAFDSSASQPGGEDTTIDGASSIGVNALADLHQTRDVVVAEVMKAPKRRIDNMITQLNDSVHLLLMHALVVEETRQRYSKLVWQQRVQAGSTMVAGAGLSGLGMYFDVLPLPFAGGLVAATALSVGGLTWFQSNQRKEHHTFLTSPEGLAASFQRTHMHEIRNGDEFTANIWQRVRDPLKMGLDSLGLENVPTLSSKELQNLHTILEEEVPRMRRLASPAHFGVRRDL
jgi:hypothetical protein